MRTSPAAPSARRSTRRSLVAIIGIRDIDAICGGRTIDIACHPAQRIEGDRSSQLRAPRSVAGAPSFPAPRATGSLRGSRRDRLHPACRRRPDSSSRRARTTSAVGHDELHHPVAPNRFCACQLKSVKDRFGGGARLCVADPARERRDCLPIQNCRDRQRHCDLYQGQALLVATALHHRVTQRVAASAGKDPQWGEIAVVARTLAWLMVYANPAALAAPVAVAVYA